MPKLVFSIRKEVPLLMQTELAECGLASMGMIAGFYGHKLDMAAMRQRFTAMLNGMNLQQLIKLGDRLGLASRALRCSLSEVHKLQTPCILHWDMNHFVVLTKVKGKENGRQFYINDPAIGKRKLSIDEFSKHYTGISLELTPTASFESKRERQELRFTQLWSSISGLRSGLLKLLALSFVLQLLTLMSPYYMQWVVDEVIVSFDHSLLTVLAIGFGLLATISVLTTAVRSWLILRLTSVLNMQLGINLLRHLLRLPMNYFESRHIGDIVSRFESIEHIRERITTGFVETIVDGFMAITVLIMMSFYSFKLTLIVLTALFAYASARFIFYAPLQQVSEELIQSSAQEQSNFIENIRGMQSIKLFNNETNRLNIWQHRYAEVINSEIRLGRLNIAFESFNKLIFGLENVIIIYLAALMVISNTLTVGMILAFVAYKTQFINRATNLIEQIIQFKMMRLHLSRIADIALTKQEQHRDGTGIENIVPNELSGQLRLENISFAYTSEQSLILENISLTVNPSESIAITGLSGCGKTTLMKIMVGLLEPTAGRVLLNEQDITKTGLLNYRQKISAVLQEDKLLSGSIAENICFFDSEPNHTKIQHCAKLAEIDKDIEQLTMGYNSLVGDMGANLSGGQIQRVLLARALYQSPTILFMDEATSHLDTINELKICDSVSELPMTRVIVAHRKDTIKTADRVFKLEGGKLTELSNY